MAKFPCLLIFRDIRTPEHFQVTLKEMSAEAISEHMRLIFDTIHKAVEEDEDLFTALERNRDSERFRKSGTRILSRVGGVAGKTLEAAIVALVETTIK